MSSAYHQQAIPSAIDEEIGDVLVRLSSCDEDELASVADGIAGERGRVLSLFAERMASLAVRKNSPDPIGKGLAALLIVARSEDVREILLVLSLLHDAAMKVRGSAKALFAEAASKFGQAELLDSFLLRSDAAKRIEAMGYKESDTGDGFLYVRTW